MKLSTQLFQDLPPLNTPEGSGMSSKTIKEIETISSLYSKINSICTLEGRTILVHASLSSLGYMSGGTEGLMQSLLKSVGTKGNIVLPAFTGDNTDPVHWLKPPVDNEGIRREILLSRPPYSPKTSLPWDRVGQLPKTAVTWPGAIRSPHPQNSFVAIGPDAFQICQPERLQFDFPNSSSGPLGRILDLDGVVLMLGTSWTTCTSLHLVEERIYNPIPKNMIKDEISVVEINGQRNFAYYQTFRHITDDFEEIGEMFWHNFKPKCHQLTLNFGKVLRIIPIKLLIEKTEPIMRKVRKIE